MREILRTFNLSQSASRFYQFCCQKKKKKKEGIKYFLKKRKMHKTENLGFKKHQYRAMKVDSIFF